MDSGSPVRGVAYAGDKKTNYRTPSEKGLISPVVCQSTRIWLAADETSLRSASQLKPDTFGQTDVKPLLQEWLDELRADGLKLSTEPGAGANQNLWCVSLPSTEAIAVRDVLEFLQSAMAVRRELASVQPVRPVAFYAWHDEMAGQLRFSTACCTRNTLPFRAKVRLVDDPVEIVTAFLQSPYRDGVPWNELEDSNGNGVADAPAEEVDLKVWAVDWQ